MKDKFNKKYIIITKDLQKNLIEFLDEIQFDAAGNDDKDSMHKVNFVNWAINELLSGYEAYFPKNSKKKREDYVDETFLDWNLPEMSDEEYNKLVDQVDNFLRNWEKKYKKSKSKTRTKKESKKEPKSNKPYVPPFEDVAEYMSLEEIKEFLLDDPELTDEERFDLYYEERERVRNKGMSYDELLKKSGLKPPIKKK
jgi:hypothetical protein